jgi:hypothetical protein
MVRPGPEPAFVAPPEAPIVPASEPRSEEVTLEIHAGC